MSARNKCVQILRIIHSDLWAMPSIRQNVCGIPRTPLCRYRSAEVCLVCFASLFLWGYFDQKWNGIGKESSLCCRYSEIHRNWLFSAKHCVCERPLERKLPLIYIESIVIHFVNLKIGKRTIVVRSYILRHVQLLYPNPNCC